MALALASAMVRKPLLVVAAFLAVECAAQAETIVVSDEPAVLLKTEYETVDDADGFVLMRAAGSSEGMVRFKIEESLKGVTGNNLWLTGCLAAREPDPLGPSCEYREGARYAIFLARDEEDGWTIPDFAGGAVDPAFRRARRDGGLLPRPARRWRTVLADEAGSRLDG